MTFLQGRNMERTTPHQRPAGFKQACGPGWTALIDQFLADVQDVAGIDGIRAESKHGLLRLEAVLPTGASPADRRTLEKAELLAEHRSQRVCEKCGKPGRLREGAWLEVACDTHSEGRHALPFDDGGIFIDGEEHRYDESADRLKRV